MPPDTPPRPSLDAKTTIAASVTVRECQRLHALAAARQITLSQLVVDALENTYGSAETIPQSAGPKARKPPKRVSGLRKGFRSH